MRAEQRLVNTTDAEAVQALPGITRRTLAYNPQVMLCHFTISEGAEMPMHSHPAAQVGYVVRGRLAFSTEQGGFEAGTGSSYSFGPNEKHGATALETTEVIECFAPSRSEYERPD
jgi:quercetin dioxygenase-like cupin family protein